MTAKLVSVFGVCFSVNFLVFFSSFGGWEYAFSERTTFFSTCHGFPFMKNVRTPEISRTLLEVAFEGVACLRADARRVVIVFFHCWRGRDRCVYADPLFERSPHADVCVVSIYCTVHAFFVVLCVTFIRMQSGLVVCVVCVASFLFQHFARCLR